MPVSHSMPLLLFAKAPIAGKVKTRLQTHCSPEQAADIAEILLEASLQNACLNWPGEVFVSTWLDAEHPRLVALCQRFNVPVLQQCEGDLGAKMHHAFEQYGYPMAIMGCDAPHTAPSTLTQLHACLMAGQSAVGPSLDGGYYIIGLSEAAPEMFINMPWGSSDVLQISRRRNQAVGLTMLELPTLRDIDEWRDVLAERQAIPRLNAYVSSHRLA